jgi:hypothetical protein
LTRHRLPVPVQHAHSLRTKLLHLDQPATLLLETAFRHHPTGRRKDVLPPPQVFQLGALRTARQKAEAAGRCATELIEHMPATRAYLVRGLIAKARCLEAMSEAETSTVGGKFATSMKTDLLAIAARLPSMAAKLPAS